jgi:CRISPR system Cascade subunit CasE
MFLSQLLVNPGDHPDKPRPGLDWMKQTYRVHQRIWMAFPDTHRIKEDPFFLGTWSSDSLAKPKRQEGGFLFRIEPEPPLRILVQSTEKPRWDYAFQNAPHLLAGEPQVREYDPAFTAGQTFRFRLVAQMVTRRTIPTAKLQQGHKARSEHPIRCLLPAGADGRRKPDPNFTSWRERLGLWAERHGFTVGDFPKHLRVQPISNLTMKPVGQQRPEPFNAAMFEGLLTCTDPERLHAAVLNGLGRGKAFGMGLLSLAVLR